MTPDDWNVAGTWATIAVTLGIAVVGWTQAIRSERRAKTADTNAAEALELARSAEARADRLERITLEKRDIEWERRVAGGMPSGHAVLSFINIGTDPAFDVELAVDPIDPPGPRKTEHFARIEPTEPIGMHPAAFAPGTQGHGVRVRVRLTWRSESGVPGIKDIASVAL